MLSKTREKLSLVFYYGMIQRWCKEVYTDCCTRKEGSGIAWLKVGIWKLKQIRRGFEEVRRFLCLGEKDF
jgi:hypothetical protein